MAVKFEEPFEETIDLYKKRIEKTGLDKFIKITILGNSKAKDIFKVTKASDILKYRAGDDIIIFINEKIFDQLTDEQREMIVDESLAGISYDDEKDKLTISKPDIVTFSGIISKFGFDKYSTLHETIKLIYAQEGDKEEAEA
jgi:hypothetical protein